MIRIKTTLSFVFCILSFITYANTSYVHLGNWSGGGALKKISIYCFENVLPPVNLLAYGQGDNGEFVLFNGNSELPFNVKINAKTSKNTLTHYSPVRISEEQQISRTCKNGLAVRMLFSIRRSELFKTPAGIYNGLLTLVVTPE